MSDTVADDLLRSGFERWQRLEGEKQAISDDLKELFAELKGHGFDGKALRAAFRTVAKIDDADVQEHNAVVELYVESLTAPRSGTVHATRTRAARETNPNTQPSPKAGQAATAHEPVVTSSVENEAAEISTPIQPETATSFADAAAHSVEANDHDSNAVASVPATQDGNANTGGQNEDRSRTRSVTIYRRPGSEPAPNAGQTDDEHQRIGTSETNEAPAGRVADESPALNTYAAPGIVVMETTPPEGATAHPYAACWPVRDIDVSEGVREPIVKIGKLILDGRGRMFAARGWNGGKGMAYPVVQYDGTDPLMDCIRWNLASRPNLHPHNLKIIAQKLVKEAPERADEIHAAMGLVDEVAA